MAEARLAGAAVLVLAVIGLAGCSNAEAGQPTPTTSSGQPGGGAGTSASSRPETLSLTGVDPCSLLTGAQQSQFAVHAGVPLDKDSVFNSPTCGYQFNSEAPGAEYVVDTVTSHGIDYWLNPYLTDNVTKVTVSGFPAVTITSKATLATGCTTAVSVANGQMLMVNDGVQPHDATVPQSCARTEQVAAAAVATLQSVK